MTQVAHGTAGEKIALGSWRCLCRLTLTAFSYPVQKLMALENASAISKHEEGEEPLVFGVENTQGNGKALADFF
jgi:hypothetical protein